MREEVAVPKADDGGNAPRTAARKGDEPAAHDASGTKAGATKSQNKHNLVARAGGPASTSYKVIDESAVTVPSNLPPPDHGDSPRATPSGPEVAEAARRLDIDLVFDADLLYIAEELLVSPVPRGWETHADDQGRVYYASKATSKTQWQHPMEEYYKGVVFMRKEGEQLLEEKASRSPPTPEETREMARYFGVHVTHELDLMDIAKAAVNAPLPPEWEEYEDDSGEVLFFNIITKKTSEHHPLDAYFFELVRQRRSMRAANTAVAYSAGVNGQWEAEGEGAGDVGPAEATYGVADFWKLDDRLVPYPWMEFVHPNNGQLYFYNFKESVAAYCHPVHLIREKLKVLAIINVQKMFRGWSTRRAAGSDEAHVAASKIQSAFRGKLERDKVYKGSHAKLVKATLRIQRWWHGKKAAMEVGLMLKHASARVIQHQVKIRTARKRSAMRIKYGPHALPPSIDRLMPPMHLLQETAAALLTSPAPFATALAALDAFTVPREAGTETRLKATAAAGGAQVVAALTAAQRPAVSSMPDSAGDMLDTAPGEKDVGVGSQTNLGQSGPGLEGEPVPAAHAPGLGLEEEQVPAAHAPELGLEEEQVPAAHAPEPGLGDEQILATHAPEPGLEEEQVPATHAPGPGLRDEPVLTTHAPEPGLEDEQILAVLEEQILAVIGPEPGLEDVQVLAALGPEPGLEDGLVPAAQLPVTLVAPLLSDLDVNGLGDDGGGGSVKGEGDGGSENGESGEGDEAAAINDTASGAALVNAEPKLKKKASSKKRPTKKKQVPVAPTPEASLENEPVLAAPVPPTPVALLPPNVDSLGSTGGGDGISGEGNGGGEGGENGEDSGAAAITESGSGATSKKTGPKSTKGASSKKKASKKKQVPLAPSLEPSLEDGLVPAGHAPPTPVAPLPSDLDAFGGGSGFESGGGGAENGEGGEALPTNDPMADTPSITGGAKKKKGARPKRK